MGEERTPPPEQPDGGYRSSRKTDDPPWSEGFAPMLDPAEPEGRSADGLGPNARTPPPWGDHRRPRAGLLAFFEQPLVTLPFGILGGLVGMFLYSPVLVICGICIILAFHRARVVSGKRLQVQIASYLLICIVTAGMLYCLQRLIQHGLDKNNISLADLIVSRLPPTLKTVGGQTVQDFPKRVEAAPISLPPRGAPSVRLIFKDSPGFTAARKRMVQETIDSYYSYLVGMGFDPPKDLPPLGLVAGSSMPFLGAAYGSSALQGGISIGADSGVEGPAMAYGYWAFYKLLEPIPTYDREMNWTHIHWELWVYFGRVFLNREDSVPAWLSKGERWLPALLEIRGTCGAYFTDHSLALVPSVFRVPLRKV